MRQHRLLRWSLCELRRDHCASNSGVTQVVLRAILTDARRHAEKLLKEQHAYEFTKHTCKPLAWEAAWSCGLMVELD